MDIPGGKPTGVPLVRPSRVGRENEEGEFTWRCNYA